MRLLNSLRQSIFASVAALVLFLLVVILLSLFYYLTYTQVAAANRSATITAQLTAQSVMDKVDRNFYERFGDVQAFAYNKLAVAAAENDSIVAGAQEFINTMTAYYVLYDLMMICNAQGKVIAVNTKDKNGKLIPTHDFLNKNMAQQDWFKICTSPEGPVGGAWYSDFVTSPEIGSIYGTEGRGMAFAAPIRNAQGAVIGTWYNYASWKEVTEGIREQAEQNLNHDHPGSFIIMTRSNGEIISAADQKLYTYSLLVDNEGKLEPWEEEEFEKPFDDFTNGLSASKGAYTFAGKKWITTTFIPKEKISWKAFFSSDNLLAVFICLIVIGFISGYVFYFFKKHIISRLHRIKEFQQKISEGEPIEINEKQSEDELGQMTRSLTILANSLRSKSSFADEISKGNLQTEIALVSDKDVLGQSLLHMQNQLRKSQEADVQRTWAAEGLAQIGEQLRANDNNETLYANIVKFAVNYLKANQGGLFLVKEGDEKKVMLAACYAYDRKKFIQKEFEFNQGLIGQSLLEQRTIYLTEIPEGYIQITSGLGGAQPNALIIVPLKYNDQIYGALEIASFNKFLPYQIAFVEKLAESIAASISSLLQSASTKTILEQLQQQTEEMKSQEEEMRQNMEELSATQEEMLRKEKDYLARINLLEKNGVQ